MKVSREQVAKSRHSILESASRLFRERGFDAVKVSDVMRAAGLTHGAFYGYFKSKEDLIAQALRHVLSKVNPRANSLMAYAKEYLVSSHRDDMAGGCATAGLAAETIRQAAEARYAMTEGQRRVLKQLADGLPNTTPAKARRTAIGTWAAMVGAMTLARVIDDPQLSDEVMKQTYAFIREHQADDAE